jgi:hypothetical protein
MADFMFLMHADATGDGGDWESYLAGLRAKGVFQGGSEIGHGACFRKDGREPPVAGHIGGYIRVEAGDFEAARRLLAGNPVYEAGGTVEIRELPRS